jgi:hypothetical protein
MRREGVECGSGKGRDAQKLEDAEAVLVGWCREHLDRDWVGVTILHKELRECECE